MAASLANRTSSGLCTTPPASRTVRRAYEFACNWRTISAPMRSRSRHLLLGTAGVVLALALGAVAQSSASAGTVAGNRERPSARFRRRS